MRRAKLFLLVLLAGPAGCVDSPGSVAREYRNANNEMIDAMMVITSDAMAERMIARVFKRASKRYELIDEKIKVMVINRGSKPEDKKALIREFFESDSVHMYLTELEINRQRFALEWGRLNNLKKQLDDSGAETKKLNDLLVEKQDLLEPLRNNLTKSKMLELLFEFGSKKDWKIEGYEELYDKIFVPKRQVFAPKRDIVLTN